MATDFLAKLENIFNFRMHPVAKKYLASRADTRMIIKGNQGGGCIESGSKINMFDGALKNIEDVIIGDVVISLNDGLRAVPSKVSKVFNQGEQEVFRVTTRSGRKISVTANHPFRSINGWERIDRLNIGEYIAVPRVLPVCGSKSADSYVYKIIGYLIGDGGISGSSVKFSNINQDIILDLENCLPAGLELKKQSGDNCDFRISSGSVGKNPVIDLLRSVGLFGTNSHTKFVPDVVMKSSPEMVGLFLSRLYACDGWVDNRGVGYSSVSRQLIDDVATLLLRFGIIPRIRAKKNFNWGSNGTGSGERIDYEICIRRMSDLINFSDNIGIFAKQEKLVRLIAGKESEIPKENYDTIPVDLKPLYLSLRGKQDSDSRFKYELLRSARGKTVTRAKLKQIADIFCDVKMSVLSDSDILWDKISGIEALGFKQTYDLKIKGTQNFVANNIFVHNTAAAMLDAAMRVLGIHTDDEKNRLNDKPVRMVSKVVPIDHDDEQNQQFVEFRRLIPPELWVKKLTARSKIGRIKRLVGGTMDVEFMASTQDIDAFMSVQRCAYYQDEEIERLKFDECLMRLATSKSAGFYADTTLSMTAVKGMDWSYDSLWMRAKKIYRSKIICEKYGLPEVEESNIKSNIEAFCWATDDNPVMTTEAIDNLFYDVDDPDTMALRRYAVFRQVSGRIFKVFDKNIHIIPYDDFFDASLFRNYWHYRILDYHPSKPWYTSWVAVTPTHEWFVWNEMISNHDQKTIQDLRDDIKSESLLDEDEEFNRRTLIDPLSKVSKVKSSPSVFDELTMGDLGLRRCQSADTKDGKSDSSHRSQIKTRLKNSVLCQVPGNNFYPNLPPDIRYGHYKPTLWFLDNCEGHAQHFKSWRYVDYKHEHVKASRTVKKESQKWSDFCRNIEFLGALNPVYYENVKTDDWHKSRLFQGRRRTG